MENMCMCAFMCSCKSDSKVGITKWDKRENKLGNLAMNKQKDLITQELHSTANNDPVSMHMGTVFVCACEINKRTERRESR